MSEELVTLPRKRLEELLAIEVAYTEEHADDPQPSAADWFNRFRAKVTERERERRDA